MTIKGLKYNYETGIEECSIEDAERFLVIGGKCSEHTTYKEAQQAEFLLLSAETKELLKELEINCQETIAFWKANKIKSAKDENYSIQIEHFNAIGENLILKLTDVHKFSPKHALHAMMELNPEEGIQGHQFLISQYGRYGADLREQIKNG